ncbi:hypothetical protein RHAL1_03731 [Beijerinckiaceae bacterium RH AL1]|nr:hypothetical protein [Beijerinckiaceae bacterium]VVB49240.1 hypothetical protein RHCH11_RHCH11_03661 [Beijerinckiaceae bacterium RH CH11]VVB49319.1 hypothetical protein RHAL8_03657 [Beijerinckiaceae bacterium RH AL8]VVC56799.1 hypothetical protein RHAL1_03731 [Beijerinckiaceae bacterium RH AL1]
MHRLPILLGALLLSCCAAEAEVLTMRCTNPRPYLATYNEDARTFVESAPEATASYTILSVENTKRTLTVTGLTVNGGPTFKATFRPQKKIELFADNKLFQTDRCR